MMNVPSTPPRVFGIDVSSWQSAKIDHQKVRAAGNLFEIHKVSEGDRVIDPTAQVDFTGAKAAGLLTGCYHYAHPIHGDGANQAQVLWDHCGDTMPDLPPIIDSESADKCAGSEVIEFLVDFIEACKDLFGRPPIIYTYSYFWRSLDASARKDIAEESPLWLAYVPAGNAWTPTAASRPPILLPWSDWTFWQFSGGGTVPGVPTPCDRDVFNGDEAALRKLCGFPD